MEELRELTAATGEFPVTTPRHADPASSCFCVTGILVDYLRRLPEGLVDVHTVDSLLSVEPSMFREVIRSMPKQTNKTILFILLRHWRNVVEDDSNPTDLAKIVERVTGAVHVYSLEWLLSQCGAVPGVWESS